MESYLKILNTITCVDKNIITPVIDVKLLKNTVFAWGKNGIGDRFANKFFKYIVLYSTWSTKSYYLKNTEFEISEQEILNFRETFTGKRRGIVGIKICGLNDCRLERPIRKDIRLLILHPKAVCVHCGTSSNLQVDHKNDLYNDDRVLNIKTQTINDFQCLCGHCNTQKRQICKQTKETNKRYSALEIPVLSKFKTEFIEGDEIFDENTLGMKGTYWYDCMAFMESIDLIH
jgi:hypothetical protein